jgi:ferrous iron transport protein A
VKSGQNAIGDSKSCQSAVHFRIEPVEKAALRPYNQTITVIENRSQSTPCVESRSMPELMPLAVLRRGQVAEVGQLVGAPEQIRRLEELGLRTGARLEMIRSGAPCIIRVDGSRLCFRDDGISRVLVRTRMPA